MPSSSSRPNPYEAAFREIGRTSFGRGVKTSLIVFFLALISTGLVLEEGAGAWSRTGGDAASPPRFADFVRSLPGRAEVRYLFGGPLPPSMADLAPAAGAWGRLTRVNARLLEGMTDFENALGNRSVLAVSLRPFVQEILTGALGVGNEKAWCGREGWLFFPASVSYLTGRPFLDPDLLERRALGGHAWETAPRPDPVPAILGFARELSSRGIALVIMPTPEKPMVQPGRFTARYEGWSGPLQNPSFAGFRRLLEAEGVRVFDPAPALSAESRVTGRPVFLRTDTHWTPGGMERAARELAGLLRGEGLLPKEGPRRAFVRKETIVQNRGDLSAMLDLPARMAAGETERVVIRQVTLRGGEAWRSEPEAEILLLGDSFSNIYHLAGMRWGTGAGFAEHLGAELGRPLDAILRNDSGAFATREALALERARGVDRLAGKKLVIWQFADRELSQGDWKTEFPRVATSVASAPPAAAGTIRVRGRIAAIAPAPAAGSVAYGDCYIPIQLEDVTAVEGPNPAPSIVVFVWGMLDFRSTKENQLRVGETMELSLRPFSEVAERYGSYRHLEFTDAARLALPVYWGDTREPGGGETAGPAATRGGAAGETSPFPRPTGAPGKLAVPEGSTVDGILAALRRRAEEAEAKGEAVVRGHDGWIFLAEELHHLGAGPFWGEAAPSRESGERSGGRGSVPGHRRFQEAARRARHRSRGRPRAAKGRDLPGRPPRSRDPAGRDPPPSRRESAGVLPAPRRGGVKVLDLVPLLVEHRLDAAGTVFCKEDSHWSPRATALAARWIARAVPDRPWLQGLRARVSP